jgi:hypothetical protein
MNAVRSSARAVIIDRQRYELHDGPDRGEYLLFRDGDFWAFVRRGDQGQWLGNTFDGWLEPWLVARTMSEAR